MATPSTRALAHDLSALVASSAVSTDDSDLVAYSKDLWPRQIIASRAGKAAPNRPALVIWPKTTEEISRIVAFAAERAIPVVPFGAGSGVCAGIEPTSTSIVLDVKRMRTVHEIDSRRLVASAEAGIIGQHFEDSLAAAGFTMGHFPSSIYCSTLGGWVAARSAGQCSGRYGKIEDMLLALECVDGTGRIWSAERDGDHSELLPLVTGSEGTLGVITAAKVRIAPQPTERVLTSFSLPSTEAGLDTIRRIYQLGLRPAVARLYDPFDSFLAKRNRAHPPAAKNAEPGGLRATVKKIQKNALQKVLGSPRWLNVLVDSLPDKALGGALLILVWETEPSCARVELAEATRIALELGGTPLGEEPAKRWVVNRHAVSYRQSVMFSMGAFVDTMEVAASWSNLVSMYYAVREALRPYVFVMAHFSHAYPDGGTIYFTFAGSGANENECFDTYDAAWNAAQTAVLETGGTISHHHGAGRSKRKGLIEEYGALASLFRATRRVMDPKGIMNPGALAS